MTRIGSQLKDLRIAANLSQNEMAAFMGISQARYSDVERGDGNPSFVQLLRAARALAIDVGIFSSYELTPEESELVAWARQHGPTAPMR